MWAGEDEGESAKCLVAVLTSCRTTTWPTSSSRFVRGRKGLPQSVGAYFPNPRREPRRKGIAAAFSRSVSSWSMSIPLDVFSDRRRSARLVLA
jgi:hypothetical protein